MNKNMFTNIINFLGDINENTITKLLVILQNIDKEDFDKTSKIIIRLSSNGGIIGYAKQAYRILSNYPKERLAIHNIGSIESSAILLYFAAKTRTAMPNSRFLIHPLSWTYIPQKITLPILEKAKKELEGDIECYKTIYDQCTINAKNSIDISKYLRNDSYDKDCDNQNLEKDTLIIQVMH